MIFVNFILFSYKYRGSCGKFSMWGRGENVGKIFFLMFLFSFKCTERIFMVNGQGIVVITAYCSNNFFIYTTYAYPSSKQYWRDIGTILVILANIGQDSQYWQTILAQYWPIYPILRQYWHFYIFVRMRNFIKYFRHLFFFQVSFYFFL